MSEKVLVDQDILLELAFWARRYCDGRATYAPSTFNKLYRRLERQLPEVFPVHDKKDDTLTNKGEFWPYAQDGMYNDKTGHFDARK